MRFKNQIYFLTHSLLLFNIILLLLLLPSCGRTETQLNNAKKQLQRRTQRLKRQKKAEEFKKEAFICRVVLRLYLRLC